MKTKSRNGILAGLGLVALSTLVISKKRKHRESIDMAPEPDASTTTYEEMTVTETMEKNPGMDSMSDVIDPAEAQAIE
jgi:hypothetical protein